MYAARRYYDDAVDKETKERKLFEPSQNVYKYLITKGVNSLRMKYIGCGNKFPRSLGDAQDRRVEFIIKSS
jgi:hypothetical protein